MRVKLSKAQRLIANGAAKEQDRLNCLAFGNGKVAAADGFMMVVSDNQQAKGKTKLVPADKILKAPKGDMEIVTIGDKAILTVGDEATETELVDGTYPDYMSLFPEGLPMAEVAVSTKLLRQLLSCLPKEGTLFLRIGSPSSPVEFIHFDEEKIYGAFMPMSVGWADVHWQKENKKQEEK